MKKLCGILNSYLEDGQSCKTRAVMLVADRDALEPAQHILVEFLSTCRLSSPCIQYMELSFVANTQDPKKKY